MGIRLYNKVAVNIKKLNKYKLFKRKLKSLVMNHAFYSIDEFLSYQLDDMQEKDIYN
jgi:hypothetical protein